MASRKALHRNVGSLMAGEPRGRGHSCLSSSFVPETSQSVRLGGLFRVATYQYRCVRDGDFDVRRPIGTATPKSSCPVCGDDAVRVFRAPMLSLASRALMTAIDRTERTR